MHVDFEIVTNAKYSGGCCDAILTFTPKKSGASPVTPLTMTGGVARQMEPHRRTDRTPPVYKRHFDFTAERTKSEKDRERYRLSLVETGNDLEGTLEITKSGADRPNINSTVPLRLGPDVTQGTGDEAVAKSNEPAEAQAAPDPSNITGVYEGTYVANKREFSVELTLDRKADSNALKGVLTTFVGGVGSESLGSYNLSGDFEPLTNSFKLTPGQWIGASGGRQVGLEGTVEAAAGKLRGKTTVEAGTFELTRNPHKSSALQAKAAREERKFKEAPVALAAARSDEARCATLVRWFGKLKHEYPDIDVRHTVVDKLYPKVVNLFADDDFVPVFGKPFDVLSAEEREYFKEMGRRLFSTQPNRDLIDGFIDFLFDRPFGTTGTGNYSFPDIAGQVAFRRGITKKWHAAFEHLKEVPPTSAGFDDILTTKRAGDETFADLWPSQMEEFHDAVNAAKHRIADSALKERISMAVATAKATQNPSTLGVMQSGSTELFELASADAKNQVVAELDASIAGLLEKEEQASPITGSGLDAVTAGNAWYRRLRDAYGFAVDRPPVRQAIERLTSRRSSDLAGALATIVAEISQQEGESGLKHVKETYLAVAGDDDTEAGRRISKAMEARVAALKRAVALQRFSPNERKLVQDDLTIAIPDLVPEPDDDDLRVAVVRTLERMGAKRTQPYEVEWHDFAGNQFGFYVVVTVKSAHRSSCVREGTGYKVGYYLEIACSNPSPTVCPSVSFTSLN